MDAVAQRGAQEERPGRGGTGKGDSKGLMSLKLREEIVWTGRDGGC